MRLLVATLWLALSGAAALAAQAPAVVARRATAAPPATAVGVELVGETTYNGLTEQRGDFWVVAPAPGGGAAFTMNRAFQDTLWGSSLEARVPTAARITADFEIRQFGATGVAVALGDNDDESATPVLVMLSAGGTLAVNDRAGNVIIAARPMAGVGTIAPVRLMIEVRGSAIAVAVNGGPAVTGVAPGLIDGRVQVLAWGGSDFTVRRVRLERLTGVPAAQLTLRSSTRVTVPVARPARFFNNERNAGGSTSADTVQNIVTLAAPDTTDRSSFAGRLGRLPAAVRIEADVSMPRTCQQKIVGLSVGGRGDSYYVLLLMPQAPPLYSMSLYRLRDGNLTGLSGAVVWSNPFATPTDQRHLAVEIRGRSIGWSVDGGRVERVDVEEEVTGFMGVAAGPACTVRYANLRISPLS